MIAKTPDFFIIGAPKCGTTSFSEWLSQHPQLFISINKEPNYFNTDIFIPQRISTKDYLALFDDAPDGCVAKGEASTRYLYSNVAVLNIIKVNPNAKFIVIIRNPIEMAVSLHQHLVFNGAESLKSFDDAWQVQRERENGFFIPKNCHDPDSIIYSKICLLGEQIERLFKTVPIEQRLVILLDDMKNNPAYEYEKALKFLGVDSSFQPDFTVKNEARTRALPTLENTVNCLRVIKKHIGFKRGLGILNFLSQINVKKVKLDISLEKKQELRKYFQDDIYKLSHLLERDLSHWLIKNRNNTNDKKIS